MYVAIVGSREYPNLELVIEFVKALPENTIIVSGGARGVDRTAEVTADQRKLSKIIYKPVWHRPDGSKDLGAGMKRNQLIVDRADVVVVFWDGVSSGSRDSINKAMRSNKRLHIAKPEDTTVEMLQKLARGLI